MLQRSLWVAQIPEMVRAGTWKRSKTQFVILFCVGTQESTEMILGSWWIGWNWHLSFFTSFYTCRLVMPISIPSPHRILSIPTWRVRNARLIIALGTPGSAPLAKCTPLPLKWNWLCNSSTPAFPIRWSVDPLKSNRVRISHMFLCRRSILATIPSGIPLSL